MFTKKEMEDIWNHKPVGYLKTQMKGLKGKKKYKVVLRPYTVNKVWHPNEEFVVLAKNKKEAEYQCAAAYSHIRKMYGSNTLAVLETTEI